MRKIPGPVFRSWNFADFGITSSIKCFSESCFWLVTTFYLGTQLNFCLFVAGVINSSLPIVVACVGIQVGLLVYRARVLHTRLIIEHAQMVFGYQKSGPFMTPTVIFAQQDLKRKFFHWLTWNPVYVSHTVWHDEEITLIGNNWDGTATVLDCRVRLLLGIRVTADQIEGLIKLNSEGLVELFERAFAAVIEQSLGQGGDKSPGDVCSNLEKMIYRLPQILHLGLRVSFSHTTLRVVKYSDLVGDEELESEEFEDKDLA